MKERFTLIDEETARALLGRVEHMTPAHRGIDRQAYLFDDIAVLKTGRLKLRNVDVRDDELTYLDDIIVRLSRLNDAGVNAVPILGWCCDEGSPDGNGYLFMRRAKGAELYDDAIVCRYEAWTQGLEDVYLKSDADAAEYILRRTNEVARIPQEHFDKFISDATAILKEDILIDFQGKSNFFYDEEVGFQFIDLDSHTDVHYGLTDEIIPAEAWAALGGFVPCHFGAGTKAFAPNALDPSAISEIGELGLEKLKEDNLVIFENAGRPCGRTAYPRTC